MKARWAGLAAGALLLSSVVLATAAQAEPSLSFSAVGDLSSSTDAGRVLTSIGSDADDLTVALGDLSYGPAGASRLGVTLSLIGSVPATRSSW